VAEKICSATEVIQGTFWKS